MSAYKQYTVRVYDDRTEWLNSSGELHAVEWADGSKFWYLNGTLLSEEEFKSRTPTCAGPAIEHSNGSKLWYLNGQRHREDGPAVELPNGDKAWYLNGKFHREDGPAVEWANGDKYWYLNGKLLSEEEFKSRSRSRTQTCSGRVVEIDGLRYKLELMK